MIKRTLKKILKSSLAKRNKVIIQTMENLGRSRHLNVGEAHYTNEYVRLSQLDLAINEIKLHNVPGDIAEVGVYHGDFAAVLNRAMPDRTLYLFDTFEGFDSEQEQFDIQAFGMTHKRDFSDTSADFVLSRMVHPERCVIRKGLFPKTTTGLEHCRFCFVSLDPDLYEPIRDGLAFFYDRMSPGGFIFVHDYNNSAFPGAKQAVLEFAKKRNVAFVPITDAFGTAIFGIGK